VNAIAVSPDGTQAVSGGQDQDLVLWDLTNEQFIRRLENGHTDIVLSVAYTSDADHIVSGSVDTTLLLWDVDVTSPTYSQPIRQFEGHDSVVSAVDFAPNGSSVVSASRDGTVRLWDVSNGFELRRFSSEDGTIPRTVDFNDDGRTVLTGMDDSTLREWRVLTDRSDLIAWTLLNRHVREATCRERQLFDIVPLCDAEGNSPVPREPFPLPSATPAPDVPQLAVGGTATVNTDGGDNLLLRSVPDNSDGDGNVVERLPDASTVTLVEGPLQAGGYTWWLVRAESGVEGWAVQSVPQDGLQTLIAN
jgi:WD40 repeat protein